MRLLVALMACQLAAMGLAQEVAASDYREWFSNPVVAALVLVGAVEWLQRRYPWVDGPVRVPLVAFGVGIGAGVLGQASGLLTYELVAGLAFPWGGVAYGAAVAALGFFGVNVFDMIAKTFGKKPDKRLPPPDGDLKDGHLPRRP